MKQDNYGLWVERYRPTTIDDVILPERLKKQFRGMIESGDLLNMTFDGGPGIGKTTVAIILCESLGIDYILMNAGTDGNIDTLRNEVQQFASTVSLVSNGPKVIIFDEADNMSRQTQEGLKGFIEEFNGNCRFIMTTNNSMRLLPAILSRCPVISFDLSKKESKQMGVKMFGACRKILKENEVEYDKEILARLVFDFAPEWRSLIGYLQHCSLRGSIGPDALSGVGDSAIRSLVELLKETDWSGMVQWVNDYPRSYSGIYRSLFNHCEKKAMVKESLPALILIIGDYSKWHSSSADEQIHMIAFFTEIMKLGPKWK